MCDHQEVSITWTEPNGPKWNAFFNTTCLWPLPVHTWVLSGIIVPPLLHDPGRNSVCVIHQLEASDIGSTLPEFGQVNVHESLVQERNRRSSSEEDIWIGKKNPAYVWTWQTAQEKYLPSGRKCPTQERHQFPDHGVNLLFSQVLSWPYPVVTTQGDK